jgi:hypothetical protein
MKNRLAVLELIRCKLAKSNTRQPLKPKNVAEEQQKNVTRVWIVAGCSNTAHHSLRAHSQPNPKNTIDTETNAKYCLRRFSSTILWLESNTDGPTYSNPFELNEQYSLLGCNAVQFGESATFLRNFLPPSSASKSKPRRKPAEAGGKLGKLRQWQWLLEGRLPQPTRLGSWPDCDVQSICFLLTRCLLSVEKGSAQCATRTARPDHQAFIHYNGEAAVLHLYCQESRHDVLHRGHLNPLIENWSLDCDLVLLLLPQRRASSSA